jgi:hypothetical protein
MFKTSFYGATDRTKVACEDCDWQGEACELEGISDFSERVAPGEICPAGECPECGALAHVAKARVDLGDGEEISASIAARKFFGYKGL